MSRRVIGIDPGLSGAIAIYDGEEIDVWEMPLRTVAKQRRRTVTRQVQGEKIKSKKMVEVGQNYVDEEGLHELMLDKKFNGTAPRVYLEEVHAMPQQGVTSMFNFGMAYGIVRGMFSSWEYEIVDVRPQEWRKYLDVLPDKEGSIITATALMPDGVGEWHSHDGKAEAALIAYYGWEKENER